MKRFTMTVAALVASMTLVGAASAKPGSGNGGSKGGSQSNGGNSVRSQNGSGSGMKSSGGPKSDKKSDGPKVDKKFDSHQFDSYRSNKVAVNKFDKGHNFRIDFCPSKYKHCDFGYCFFGQSCCHWEYKYWVPTYGCYIFYCPYTIAEYWLCVEDDCYYPIGYIPVAYRVKYKFSW